MTKALCLSGGGARGSFQMGAIKCLYTRFGFRPDMIVGTSVGAVNGVKLAEGKPEAPDTQLAAMQELDSLWWSTVERKQFFLLRPEFSMFEGALDSTGPGGRMDYSTEVGLISVLAPFTGPLGSILLSIGANAVNNLIANLQTLNSLCVLDPIELRLRDENSLDLLKVANGTPLFLATVSLETGALRYVTGNGIFVERDGVTPVASALEASRLHPDAFSGNTADLAAAQAALSDYKAKQQQVADLKEESARASTTNNRRFIIRDELRDLTPKAETALRQLRAAIRNHPGVTATASIVDGVIASAAIPGIFGGKKIGTENYVDGGVRDVIPVEIAVRRGIDEIVAISCSSNSFPDVESFDRAGVINCLFRALIDTSLSEVSADDLRPAGLADGSLTLIAPTFDVHSSIHVIPSLFEIAMHYGFMRAGDVMQPGLDAEARADAFTLSDALARLRLDIYDEERLNPGMHVTLRLLRVRKWVVKHLVAERKRRQLPVPDLAELWAFEWERDFRQRSVYRFGLGSAWEEYRTSTFGSVETTPAASLGTYQPDGFTVEDRATGARFELVRGAAFPTSAPPLGVLLTLPPEVSRFLPRIPPGQNILVTAGETLLWYCDGRRRYRIDSPAVLTAIGMNGAPAATVPAGGLVQIPDGGPPYFAGALVIVDNLGRSVLDFEMTQRENSNSTFTLSFLNRSSVPITINEITPVFEVNAGLSVDFTGTMTIPASTSRPVTFRFAPTAAGSFEGFLNIRSTATLIPNFRFPMTMIASPEAPHGELRLNPAAMNFEGRAGQTQTRQLTLTNVGATDGGVSGLVIDRESTPGTFQVSSRFPFIRAGQSDQISVSWIPQGRGRAAGRLLIDFASLSTQGTRFVETFTIPLTSLATAPVIALRRTRPALSPGVDVLIPVSTVGGSFAGRFVDRFGSDDGVRIDLTDVDRIALDPGIVPIPTQPLDVDLGDVDQGMDANGSFFIGNLGDADLTVTGIAVRAGGFYGDPISFPFVVTPGEWREIAVHTGTGGFIQPGDVISGEWSVLSDDPSQPDARVPLRVRVSGPKLERGPDFIDFGAVAAGTQASRTMVLTNRGNRPVTVNDAKWSVGAPFVLTLPSGISFPTTLAPGAMLSLTISVPANTATGMFVDYLTVSARLNVPNQLATGFQVRVY